MSSERTSFSSSDPPSQGERDGFASRRRIAEARARHQLTITAENNEGLRLSLAGEFDLYQCDELMATIEKMYNPSIVIDLSELEFIDSSGIRALILLKRRVERDRGQLKIFVGDSPVIRAFQASGMTGFFELEAQSSHDGSLSQ